MNPLRRAPLALALALALSSCIHIYEPRPQPPSGAPGAAADAKPGEKKEDEKKEPFKKWEEVLKDTRAIDGYFKFHLKRDQTLFLELRPEQLDKDFGMVLHISRGVGDFQIHDGLPLSDMQLMRFRRVGDAIHLVHRNPRFTADPGSPMLLSLEDNIGHSIAEVFKIESEHKDTKALLVDATKFFVSDYADNARWLKLFIGNKPVSFQKDKSYVGKVLGFPKNVEIDAELTYTFSDPPPFPEAVADFRAVPFGVRYSLLALPDVPMRPRLADDRVGHFVDAVRDFSRDQKETSYVRFVNRWRLEKKDPAADASEPVQPIVYYIDRSVPTQYRRYVKEGIEGWNKAFEQAGFKNAIVAREAPDADTTWSAEDARYSTVRWTAAHRMGYAIGPSQTDPRTGEILNADVLISSEFVTAWLFAWQQLAGPDQMIGQWQEAERLRRELPRAMAERMCLAELGKSHELAVGYAFLIGQGVIDGGQPMPEEYLGDAIRDLVFHEVGHTLGLRHNFKASASIPYDRLNDTAYTAQHGLTLSVMDYAPVNVALDPKKQGHWWNKEVGSYDVWAIQYAYAPIYQQSPDAPFAYSGKLAETAEQELVGLRKIASQAADPMHAYNTDQDTHLGPLSVDPLSNTFDLGSDPLRYARDRTALVNRVQPTLESRLIAQGEGYQRLRGATATLIFERYRALFPVTKSVGGLHTARDHKGDPSGRLPFTPVPAAKQREAVQLIVDNAFAEDAFRFDPELLNKLAPSRWWHWGVPFYVVPIDFPIHDWVLTVQAALLDQLLDQARLERMIDNEVRMPRGTEPYRVSELFETLTGAIWSELGEAPRVPRNVGSFRRNLQREHIGIMSRLMLDIRSPFSNWPAPEDARSLARWELTQLSQRLGQALAAGGSLDTVTRAHFAESRARIDRALEASVALPTPR